MKRSERVVHGSSHAVAMLRMRRLLLSLSVECYLGSLPVRIPDELVVVTLPHYIQMSNYYHKLGPKGFFQHPRRFLIFWLFFFMSHGMGFLESC